MINFILMLALFIVEFQSDSTTQKLQDKFKEIKYIQADFNQSSSSGGALVGKFYFGKENNYRIVLKNNIIISNGSSIWNNDLKRNKVVVSSIDDDPLAFSLSEYIFEYPEICKISEQTTDEGYLLILDGSETDLNFKTAQLYINRDYIINKIIILDFGGNSLTFQFRNIIIDNPVSDSFFDYKPDGNTKIIDLR